MRDAPPAELSPQPLAPEGWRLRVPRFAYWPGLGLLVGALGLLGVPVLLGVAGWLDDLQTLRTLPWFLAGAGLAGGLGLTPIPGRLVGRLSPWVLEIGGGEVRVDGRPVAGEHLAQAKWVTEPLFAVPGGGGADGTLPIPRFSVRVLKLGELHLEAPGLSPQAEAWLLAAVRPPTEA